MKNRKMATSLMQAVSDNRASVDISAPAHGVSVIVSVEDDGYKRLTVIVDGRERLRVRRIHPRLLEQ